MSNYLWKVERRHNRREKLRKNLFGAESMDGSLGFVPIKRCFEEDVENFDPNMRKRRKLDDSDDSADENDMEVSFYNNVSSSSTGSSSDESDTDNYEEPEPPKRIVITFEEYKRRYGIKMTSKRGSFSSDSGISIKSPLTAEQELAKYNRTIAKMKKELLRAVPKSKMQASNLH